MPKLRLLDCVRSWLPHLLETGQKSRQELLGSCKTRGREFCLEGTMPPFLLGNFQTWKKKTFNLADKEFSVKTRIFMRHSDWVLWNFPVVIQEAVLC